MGARGFLCPKRVFRARKGAGRARSSGNGTFVGARGFSCPKRVFRARKGAGGKHTSRNGTFRGRKGLFVPKKGVSCKNRCRREYPSPHGTFRGHKGLFGGRVGRFVNKWEGRWMSRQQISQERGRRGLRGHFGGRRQQCGLSSLDGARFPVGLVKNGQCGFFSPNRRSTHLIFPFFPFFASLTLPCPFVSSSLSVSSSARCFFLFGLFCLLSSALEGPRLQVRDERGREAALVAVFETLGRRGIVLAGGK